MKRTMMMIAMVLGITASQAQVVKDDQGNYLSKAASVAAHDSSTTLTYTNAKGMVYPVYEGRKGGHYVWVTSRDGNVYRKYLRATE